MFNIGAQVLEQWLGSVWRSPEVELEFRARDGYVSHIPAERFRKYRAYLVFERHGHPASVWTTRFKTKGTFRSDQWTLQPVQAKPGTTMPGLPVSEREKIAGQLFEYFTAIPVVH